MGIHPKAAQYKSTLISLHNPDVLATLSKFFFYELLISNLLKLMLKYLIFAVFSLDRTHANFRRSEMDELYTSGNWVIGSQGNGYGKIGIFSKYCKNTALP